MNGARSRWKVAAPLGVAGVVVAAAAWFGIDKSGAFASSGDDYVPTPVANAAAAHVSVPNGASGVTPDTPVVLTAPQGENIGSVTVSDDTAHPLQGTFSPDHRTWTSLTDLRVADRYQLTAVTNDPSDGGVSLQHESFQTADEPNGISFASVFPNDGSTDGVAQPVVISFAHPVQDKAAVERALTVYSTPSQSGTWGWLSDERVDYRPQNFWSVGTKVRVVMALDGLEVGDGKFGTEDRSVDFTIGRDQETVVNVATHEAAVYQDGQQIKSFPVSAGMPGLDTWGGTFAVIDKAADVRMDSRTAGLGDEYDIPDVKWDVHVTYSGTYIHSAPWSVGAQGVTNVSHGCIGTNPETAEWYYESSLPGDVVKVVGSPRTGALGNGFNEWTLSWADWQTKSSL